jgi:hypothetical protein
MKRRSDFYGSIQSKFEEIVSQSEQRKREADNEDGFEDAQDGTEVQA